MSGLSFGSIDELPAGMRELYEKQQKKKENAFTVQKIEKEELPKNSKYHNLPTERILENGAVIKFDSKKEACYFDKLKLLEKCGVVKDIRLQVQFVIQTAFTDSETGERCRAINYLADFTYDQLEENNEWKHHIVDVKGKRTKEYLLKKKSLLDAGIRIEEV